MVRPSAAEKTDLSLYSALSRGKKISQRNREVYHDANAFTIGQTMFVLMIVVLLMGIGTVGWKAPGSGIYARTLLETLNQEQYLALSQRSSRSVSFGADRISTAEKTSLYPAGISCSPATVSWNARGSVSKGGTIHCQSGSSPFRIVVQIGSGRARIEYGS